MKLPIISDEKILQIYKDKNWIIFDPDLNRAKAVAQAQAEISFKAGYKCALEGAVMNGAYESIKKVGMKELIEWNKEKYCSHHLLNEEVQRINCEYCLEAKLKEWGINEGFNRLQ